MTIDELIQRSGGQFVPVEDRVQIKEINKLNKNIQSLIDRVEKSNDQDKQSNDKLSDKIKKLAENVVKKPAERIAPRITRPVTEKKDTKADKSDSKVEQLDRKFSDLLKAMTAKGPFAGLQPKQIAGTVDPTKVKRETFEEKAGGGGGGSMLARLLGGALLGYMLAQNWDEIKKVLTPAFDKLKEAITGALGQGVTSMLGEAKDKIDEMLEGVLPQGMGIGGAALGLAAGYGAYKLGRAGASRLGAAAGKRLAGALGLGGAAAELEAERQKRKEKEIEEEKRRRRDAEGKREARKAQRAKPITKVEPRLEPPKKTEAPRVQTKPQPVPLLEKPKEEVKVQPTETPEQREAREKALKKAQDEQRAKMQADRKKSQKTIDDVSSRRNPSMADRLKQGANAAKGKMGKVGKVALAGLRKAGPLAALAFGAYDTAKAATEAEDVLGIEGRKATVGERIAAGVGGLGEGLTLGLVSREKIAQGIAGATNMRDRTYGKPKAETKDAEPARRTQRIEPRAETKDVERGKVVQAIEQKAMDEKKRREINAEISRNKIEMHKMLRDGKKEQAMDLARETVKLQDKLKAADRSYQPARVVTETSQENADLKMASSMSSPYAGMAGIIQNVFNNQTNTNVQNAPKAQPRDVASSIERYLDKIR